MGKRAEREVNTVAEVMAALGGGTKAATIAGVRVATMYAWRDAEAVSLAGPALRLATAVAKTPAARWALACRLAGLT